MLSTININTRPGPLKSTFQCSAQDHHQQKPSRLQSMAAAAFPMCTARYFAIFVRLRHASRLCDCLRLYVDLQAGSVKLNTTFCNASQFPSIFQPETAEHHRSIAYPRFWSAFLFRLPRRQHYTLGPSLNLCKERLLAS